MSPARGRQHCPRPVKHRCRRPESGNPALSTRVGCHRRLPVPGGAVVGAGQRPLSSAPGTGVTVVGAGDRCHCRRRGQLISRRHPEPGTAPAEP
ncbi:hypothetical protein STRIP9103_01649 [Streptomyces ipomoeae 91-03]|uniref:Uncharacterized protein n=1 Tax=Streptomyces ipomoeae 91-03 TaxID=698759 RepID=L1KQB5_9ACTN|nr:hypothetical protein STRIP9103_01649 [Streptomyces ipomoeae 91-03]